MPHMTYMYHIINTDKYTYICIFIFIFQNIKVFYFVYFVCVFSFEKGMNFSIQEHV